MKEAIPKRIRAQYPDLLTEVTHVNAIIAGQEQRSNPDAHYRSKWEIHSSGLSNYAWTFDRLFYGGFEFELQEKMKQNHSASILDVMATDIAVGEALDQGFGYGMAVSLGFPRVRADLCEKIDIVNGDILSRPTWDVIIERMSKRGINAFDVIMAKPEGGLDHLTPFPLVHFRLLQRLWRILSPEQGLLVVQGPDNTYENAVTYLEFLSKLHPDTIVSSISGVDGWGFKMALWRKPGAPQSLPTPKMLGMK